MTQEQSEGLLSLLGQTAHERDLARAENKAMFENQLGIKAGLDQLNRHLAGEPEFQRQGAPLVPVLTALVDRLRAERDAALEAVRQSPQPEVNGRAAHQAPA